MAARKNKEVPSPQKPNLGRHESMCDICKHAQRGEIERDFIRWMSPAEIAKGYGLRDRSSVYRHAHAFDLFPKRTRNVRAALERMIEQNGDVGMDANAVVRAIIAYARINSRGQLAEENAISFNALFERMTPEELEAYAKDSTLPDWFTQAMA